MMTYPISSNLCKKISLHCYRIHNFPSFSSNHRRCFVRKGVLRNFAKFTGKHLWQSLFLIKLHLQAEGAGSDLSRAFFLAISCLFHFNRKMKWKKRNTLMEFKYLHFCSRVLICLTSKISKEIWQMAIWRANVFKGNLMLQFWWLEEFR